MISSYKSGHYNKAPRAFIKQSHTTNGLGNIEFTHPTMTSYGHLPHNLFNPANKEIAISCQGSGGSHFFVSHSLYSSWSSGDKGTYGTGGTPGWGNFYAGDTGGSAGARGSHYACGTAPHTGHLAGVAYCSGPGAGGSWGNHLASFTSYSSGSSIGCAGVGGNALQVWIRDYHPTSIPQKSCKDSCCGRDSIDHRSRHNHRPDQGDPADGIGTRHQRRMEGRWDFGDYFDS